MIFTDSEFWTLNVSDLSMVVSDSSFRGSGLLRGRSFTFCMSISLEPTLKDGVVRGVVSSAGVMEILRVVGALVVVVVVEVVVGFCVVVVVVVGFCVVVVVVVGFWVVVVFVVVGLGVVVVVVVVVVDVVVGFMVVVVDDVVIEVVAATGLSFLAEITSTSLSVLFPIKENALLLVVDVVASLASPCLSMEVVAVVEACVNATENPGFLAVNEALFLVLLRRVVVALVVVDVDVVLDVVVLGLGVVVRGVGGASVITIGRVFTLNIGS